MTKKIFLQDLVPKEKALKIAEFAVMLLPFTAFLRYQITATVTACIGVLFCLLPFVRGLIFARKGTFLGVAFLGFASTVALCNGNYIGFRRTLVFAALLGISAAVKGFADRVYFEKMMNACILAGCLGSVHGIVQYLLNSDVEGYRSIGFYTNPNFYGTALTFVILICAYKASTHAKHTAIFYLAAILNAVALYLSGSMSLWLVAIICIFLMLALNKEYKLLIIFSSLVAVAVVVLFAVPDIIHRLDELSATVDNRKKIWSFAIENFKDSPIVGRGFYTYKFLYSQLPTPNDVYPASMSHSVYLDSLLCHGFVGTALLLTAVSSFFVGVFSCRRKLKQQNKPSPILGFIIALSIALALYGLMDTTFVWIQTGTFIMLIASGLGVEEKEL